jgi:hypothetical protein
MTRAPLLAVLLALALPAGAQHNPLLPQIHPIEPGKGEPAKPEPEPQSKAAPKPASQQDPKADPAGMPTVSVRASAVEIRAQENSTLVFFDLGWSIDAAEAVAEVQGDLLMSDDDGHVRGRVPWTIKDPEGLPARFEERGVGFDASKSEAAQAWFKGAQPSWIHFGYLARRAVFLSGRTVECKDCPP